MDVLSSRILLRPTDLKRSQRFYRDVLGLAVYREFGPPSGPGLVFFLGSGFLEVSGHSSGGLGRSLMLWIQVRDVHAEHKRLSSTGISVLREPRLEPWGLVEMWIEDPDGVQIVLVEIPDDHPLRRDPRPSPKSGSRHMRLYVTPLKLIPGLAALDQQVRYNLGTGRTEFFVEVGHADFPLPCAPRPPRRG